MYWRINLIIVTDQNVVSHLCGHKHLHFVISKQIMCNSKPLKLKAYMTTDNSMPKKRKKSSEHMSKVLFRLWCPIRDAVTLNFAPRLFPKINIFFI